MTSAPPTVVTAAVIERDGNFSSHGVSRERTWRVWSSPGKCEPGEEIRACLVRELLEELGVSAAVGGEIHRTFYAYDDRRLELIFFECEIDGEPRPLLGQEIRWVARADLRGLAFPPADAELIEQLGKGQS